jgi:outer membrane protein assembly factor BamE (lipoprotein component of BamABCDE complex)|tara:strand:- start:202 stop:669 length:468 start_codon:yes stop_codon:yes gene_type:complete
MSFIKKFHNNLLYLLVFIILISCKLQEPLKTHGIIFLENRSQKLVLNKSNKNDVIRIMGRPHIKEDEINQSWIYLERILSKGKYHKLGRHILKENNVLVLNFDKYGVLKNKQFLKKEDLKKLEFSQKITENELTQKSFVQKFLQSIKQKMYSNRR